MSEDIIKASDNDRRALARCWECWEDQEDTDVGIPMLLRLTELGWLERVSKRRWLVTSEGDQILAEMGIV